MKSGLSEGRDDRRERAAAAAECRDNRKEYAPVAEASVGVASA